MMPEIPEDVQRWTAKRSYGLRAQPSCASPAGAL